MTCPACGCECSAMLLDLGYGYTERGSEGQTDVSFEPVSSCCEEPIEVEVEHEER